jgi:hypothetical protein
LSPPFDDTKFIGKRYGKDGQLEILAFDGYRRGKKDRIYKVKCHTCSEDPEMFGDGIYLTPKSIIDRNIEPCGCSKFARLTEKQTLVKVQRSAEDKGYRLIGYAEEYKGVATKLKLECQTCQFCWASTTVTNFLLDVGCPSCAAKVTGDRYRKSDDDMIIMFLEAKLYPEGTTFSRSLRGSGKKRNYWNVTCSVCSNDDFVKAGVCTGVFEQHVESLKRGAKSCRCGPHFRWTPEQRQHLITKTIAERGLKYKFVDWDGEYSGFDSRCVMHCEEHGNWLARADAFLYNCSGCPSCAKGGFDTNKDGHLYILLVEGRHGFTGYGISNAPDRRLTDHDRNLRRAGFRLGKTEIFQMTGRQAWEVEKAIKATFPRFSQEVEGFMTEATYPELYQDVVDFVDEWLFNNVDNNPLTHNNLPSKIQ